MNKQKILIFTDWFVPGFKAGGPIQSISNFIFGLHRSYDIYVFTSDADLGDHKPYAHLRPHTWIPDRDHSYHTYYLRRNWRSYYRMIREIRRISPDFIYLNHMFSPKYVVFPLVLKLLSVYRKQVVLSPRGALFQNALAIKTYKKIPLLKILRWIKLPSYLKFHATSSLEQKVILDCFPGSTIVVANDLPSTHQYSLVPLRKNPGELRVIFIARIHPIKNLDFILDVLKVITSPIHFTIVGPVEDASYWDLCNRKLGDLASPITVEYVGAVLNEEIRLLLLKSHLLFLPSSSENFGHSIFEAFLHGRPVLISDQTPWKNLKESGVGWDLPIGNKTAFISALQEAIAWDQTAFYSYCQRAWDLARDYISDPDLFTPYHQLFSIEKLN